MGLGFSVKLAPGLRVRASSRGIRTSVGPRAARIHVGGGRPGVSTGLGPVSYYTSVGGGTGARGRSSTGAVNRQLAAAARRQTAQDKVAEADALSNALIAITEIHRQSFPTAIRPIAPMSPPPEGAEIRQRHRSGAKAGTSVFARTARRQALAAAEGAADAEIAAEVSRLRQQQVEEQLELDGWWNSLERCEPETVLGTLVAAFEDNKAAATAVGVDGTEASLIVIVPVEDAVPDRKPTTTAAGNLSLKKLTKTEIADFYTMLVCGHMLVTLREAFAVVPRLSAARIVAVRSSGRNVYGHPTVEVVMAGLCTRSALDGVRWEEASAAQIFNECLTERRAVRKGPAGALQAIPLVGEPGLRALVDAIDLEDLTR